MADAKISALTGATTPLAGTEVVPVVQGGQTRKVSVADLTTGRALSATQLTLTTGNLIVANGQGIDFSATPGTGTSELLSDYEEGTWTPNLAGNGFLGAPATTSTSGTYTKVGRQVTVNMILDFGSSTYPGTYSIINGLPFVPVIDGTGAYLGGNPGAGVQGGIHRTLGANQDWWWPTASTVGSTQWHGSVTYFV